MMRVATLFCICAAGLSAQNPDSAFIADARAATARFKDIEVAIAENYVKMGPDFPAMGEHWVKGEYIMRGELDARRPAILTYARMGDSLVLTGAVYALALKHGDAPPRWLEEGQWHDHVGTIDEESLLFHDQHDDMSSGERLVVMHAWLWADNPAGIFATDNWSLPFERLGISAPGASPDAARAAALLSTGATYYARLFATSGALDERDAERVADVLEQHRASLTQWWDSLPNHATLAASEIAHLNDAWRAITRDVSVAVTPPAARRLERVLSQ